MVVVTRRVKEYHNGVPDSRPRSFTRRMRRYHVNHKFDRRTFVGSAVATGMFSILPRHVLGGPAHVAPSEKITLAHIGMGTQGFSELGSLLSDPQNPDRLGLRPEH